MKLSKWPYYSKDEIEAVEGVLASGKVNYWTGVQARQFEQEWATYVGTSYAVAMANGTLALEAALYALDVGPGDEVIVTPRSFIASASCVVMRGAKPVFTDVDPNSQNIMPETIEKVITPKTKAIIVVHLAGWPCEMGEIMVLAKKHNLYVIEDCAQAHGAEYKGQKVGSIGHIGSFSFCQDKIISTGGEGGMVTTNDKILWERMWSFKDHGKSYEVIYNRQHPPGFQWVHENFGTNARMTEMQAAIGRKQLRKLENWLYMRRRNADILTSYFKDLPYVRFPNPPNHIKHAYYKYHLLIDCKQLKSSWTRNCIIRTLENKGIPCFSGGCSEIYREKAFKNAGLQPAQCLLVAQQLGEMGVMFLVHPMLSEETMHFIGQTVQTLLKSAFK